MPYRATHPARRALVLVILAALALSCGESPTQPTTSFASLDGTVLDSTGRGVAGARVVVSYPYPNPTSASLLAQPASRLMGVVPVPLPSARTLTVFNNPCSLGVVSIHFGLPDTALVTARIVDRDGNQRRLLMDNMLMPGMFAITWDGRDDVDSLMAPDVYAIHLNEVQGDSTFNLSTNVLWDVSDPTAFYAIHANAQGAFSIPLSALALGQRIDAVDIGGTPLGSFVVGKSLRVTATGPAGGIATVQSETVPLGVAGKSVSVTVKLP